MAVQPGLCQTWSEIPKTGFLVTRLILCCIVGESDGRNLEELEELIWDPEAGIADRQIDQFLVIAR